MKKLLIVILLPLNVLAQTPTPTPDPDQELATRFSVSVMEVKMQRLAQAMNEIREIQKTDRSGKVGTSTDVLFDITNEQRQAIRQVRRQKLQAMKALCRDLAEPE